MTTIIIARDGQQDFHVKLQSGDTYVFKLLLDTLKSFVNPCYRFYDPGTRRWVVGAPASQSLNRWLAYARSTFNARVQWIGGAADAPPREEWAPPPPPRQRPVDPYTTLWLLPGAPAELIKQAYRVLAKLNHPDHGGDTEAMQRINDAYRRLAA